MSEWTQELRVAIYRSEPELKHRWSLYDVDFGSLFQQLTVTPSDLAGGIKGSIKQEAQRTHESELLLGLALAGGQPFLEGALREPGKRFAGWLVEQASKLGARSPAAVRPAEGEDLVVEPGDQAQAEWDIVKLLREAMES